MAPPIRVLISGAGVAGPALAWFLAKIGARITVLEKAPALLPYGQNVDIQGSARKVIKKMGVLEEVLKMNTTEKGTQLIDSKGMPFAPFPVQEGKMASPTSEFEILRGDMAKVLYVASKDHPNVKYLFGTTVKDVLVNDKHHVKVSLSNDDEGEYELLVAADGQWSSIRKQCFPSECVAAVDKNMYAAYWTIPRLSSDNDWWNVYQALDSRIITLRPDPHGTIRAMITIFPRNEAQKKEWRMASRSNRRIQEKLLRREFADAGWQAQRLLNEMSAAPDFYFQDIQQIKMNSWFTSRVVCLGDAGYAPSPLTGMGTSLALLGAYVLAGEISKLGNGAHLSTALEAYENAFRPFVEEVQKIPSIFPGVVHPTTPWQRWMFQTALSGLSRVAATPWLAKRFGVESNNEDFPLPEYAAFQDIHS